MMSLENGEIQVKKCLLKEKVIQINPSSHPSTQPLKIGIVNLMPQKEVTEEQLFGLLEKSQQSIAVYLIKMGSYESTTTKKEHLETHYYTIQDLKDQSFDGFIITGAPIETIPFEEVDYWSELTEIIEWSQTQSHSTLYICWGAMAGLYYSYGIDKYLLKEKLSGVFKQEVNQAHPLVQGFPTTFCYPQSRYTQVNQEQLAQCPLTAVASSQELGPTILASENLRAIYILGHLEYAKETLKNEYIRDLLKGLNPNMPENYFKNNDPNGNVIPSWHAESVLFYQNWLTQLAQNKRKYNTSSER